MTQTNTTENPLDYLGMTILRGDSILSLFVVIGGNIYLATLLMVRWN